jgi:RimJ/RimL family protein N-acetyltransferase
MEHLRISTFVAKITDSNAASIALFAKLGFIEAKRIAAFEEVHMVCGPAQGLRERVHAITGKSSYREHKYTWDR